MLILCCLMNGYCIILVSCVLPWWCFVLFCGLFIYIYIYCINTYLSWKIYLWFIMSFCLQSVLLWWMSAYLKGTKQILVLFSRFCLIFLKITVLICQMYRFLYQHVCIFTVLLLLLLLFIYFYFFTELLWQPQLLVIPCTTGFSTVVSTNYRVSYTVRLILVLSAVCDVTDVFVVEQRPCASGETGFLAE